MNARAASCVPILAALALLGLAGPSAAANPWSLARGEYSSDLSGALFSTTSKYNASGDRFGPNLRYESRDLAWTNEFGWKRRVSTIFGLGARSVTEVSGSAASELTQTGLTDLTLGLKWNLMNGPQGAALQLDWNAPLGYDRALSANLGDGRHRLTGALAFGSALGSRAFAQASVGWMYRFLTFGSTDSAFIAGHSTPVTSASFATLSADAGMWVAPRLLIGGRYQGQSVLSSSIPSTLGDKNSEIDATRQLVGPFVLLRVDDRLDVKAGTFSTAAGKNTYHFNQFWVALAFKQSRLNRLQGFLGSAHP